MAGGATFSCDSCGKQYPWKSELAGKKAKCKCGAVLNIPTQPQAARAVARTPVAVAAAAPLDESQGYRCPACKNDLTPGTAICVNCGYDLRTGQYVSTQVDTGDDEAEAAPTPKKKKKKVAAAAKSGKPSATAWVGVTKSAREKAADQEVDKSRTMKQVIIALVLCVAVVGVIFGGKFAFSKMGNKGSAVKLPGQDAEAMRMLNENQPMEAKEFIESHKSRMIGTMWTQAKALAKIKQWYEMGAVKVYVPSDGLIARFVIIELPQDPAKREALINWQAVFEDENGNRKTIKDEGQKYVIYSI
ncbi:MAG TPA: hypothetical protein VGP94_00425 [Tepidisphaeraceae bacterium]|jgi:hypothetical protein|nr:hypothetical protein [Tepidisphaeraceae bacterium]